MNLLAHCYLSGNSTDLLIGNFIADSIKGKHYDTYNDEIIRGIKLHRMIDEFTDNHDIVKISKRRLAPKYGKYAAVIVDIFYDHLLALNWKIYSDIELKKFAIHVYEVLLVNEKILPEKVQEFLPYMVEQNWLYNYSTIEGIDKSLKGMAHRAKFDSHMEIAAVDLKENLKLFGSEFELFFPELIQFVTVL